jgi:hypothetical protein
MVRGGPTVAVVSRVPDTSDCRAPVALGLSYQQRYRVSRGLKPGESAPVCPPGARAHDVVRAAMERREFDPAWERTRLLRR